MTTQKTTDNLKLTRQFTGIVKSSKQDKTIQVEVKTRKTHPVYQKQYWVSKTYPVHDEKGIANVGDTVSFQECRPLSKTKRWRIVRVEKAAVKVS